MCLAIPGKLIEIIESENSLTGRVSFGGVIQKVSIALLPDIKVGDYLLVHAGVAINRLDEEEALKTLMEFEKLSI